MILESAVDRKSGCIERRPLSPSTIARKSDAPESSGASALRQRVGNQGIQRLLAERVESGRSSGAAPLRSPPIQTKLTVSEPGDAYEREADHVADVVMRMPANEVADMSNPNAIPQVQRMEHGGGAAPVTAPVAANIQALRGGGSALPAATRAFFEPRFGADFSNVRVHTDDRVQEAAKSLGARAFTVGRDIAFGPGQYAPDSQVGRHLLAHELTHVVQQGGVGSQGKELLAGVSGSSQDAHVARQLEVGSSQPQIPTDLQSSPALRSMAEQALQDRYDRIVAVLGRFDRSTPDIALLNRQLVDISNELARRIALQQGRTFDPRVIDLMKAYLVKNAKTERDSCIVCMNKGIRKLLEDPKQKLTPESVDATMELLRKSGRASEARSIGFADARGRVTRGGERPHRLLESIGKALLEMVGRDVGWSVFGMSVFSGYHSVLLTVDTNDPSSPRIYWSDQWKSKGGWKEYSEEALDREVTQLIQGWWDEQPEGKKHTLVVRLWRLRR